MWGGVAVAKIWLVQQAPQWYDVPPDSLTYQLNAQAMAAHWQGLNVDGASFNLKGILALYIDHVDKIWQADDTYAYSSVLGSHEWLYTAYLGVWRLVTPDWVYWAVYSNAAWAAFFPAAAFGFVRCLGGSVGIARFAAILALLDPSAAVNGAWLLKDTIAGWLTLVALLAAIKLIQKPQWRVLWIFAVAAGVLCAVRFVASAAIFIAVISMVVLFLIQRRWMVVVHLTTAVVAASCIFSLMYQMPFNNSRPMIQSPIYLFGTILKGQGSIITERAVDRVQPVPQNQPDSDGLIRNSHGEVAAAELGDPAVGSWLSRYKSDPVKALTTSLVRTLFAPYPWVALTHGMDYENGIELYYPGVIFWMLCLPCVLWALLIYMRHPPKEFLFVILVLCSLLGAYVLFFGEWSTRQRVFILPVFFSFAALGWNGLRLRQHLT